MVFYWLKCFASLESNSNSKQILPRGQLISSDHSIKVQTIAWFIRWYKNVIKANLDFRKPQKRLFLQQTIPQTAKHLPFE